MTGMELRYLVNNPFLYKGRRESYLPLFRDNWARTQSPNRNVKVYIGAPASSTAAGSGFVDINTLSNIARTTRSQFSSFGGVMLWDASQAFGMQLSSTLCFGLS